MKNSDNLLNPFWGNVSVFYSLLELLVGLIDGFNEV